MAGQGRADWQGWYVSTRSGANEEHKGNAVALSARRASRMRSLNNGRSVIPGWILRIHREHLWCGGVSTMSGGWPRNGG